MHWRIRLICLATEQLADTLVATLQTKSVTIELSKVARHQLYAKDKVCYDTALGFSFDGLHAKEVLGVLSQARRNGYNAVVCIEK